LILRSFVANAFWETSFTRTKFTFLTGAAAHDLVTTKIDEELVVTSVEFFHKAGSS
jgi:hypothetical protein